MPKRSWLLATGAAAIALPIAYLLLWPSPIQPVAWTPTPAFASSPTGSLVGAARFPLPTGHGPEDVHVDAAGDVFVGGSDGVIWRFRGPEATALVHTGGRPLGLHGHPDGRLLVADAYRGLLAVDTDSGEITVLATTCGGLPLVFTDDVDVGPDGTIWFTDATQRFPQAEWKLDILENGTTGRLCALSPGDTEPRQVKGGFAFANGVAVAPSGAWVLVNETSRYRVHKVWPDGRSEVLVDGLPGFNDGISTGDGVFWIAMAAPRSGPVDATAGHPWLRKVITRLPDFLQPAPARSARAIAIDADGHVIHDLVDPAGTEITTVTSVQEHQGKLYLGSLAEPAFAVVPAP